MDWAPYVIAAFLLTGSHIVMGSYGVMLEQKASAAWLNLVISGGLAVIAFILLVIA